MSSHTENRTIHDADSHLIEPRGWLENYASDYVRENLDQGLFSYDMPELKPWLELADRRLAGEEFELTEALKANLFGHKMKLNQWAAFGAYARQIEQNRGSSGLNM